MRNKNKRRYMDGCFCGDWVDVEVKEHSSEHLKHIADKKRKDLNTLLEELETIKQNLERIEQKQALLDELMLRFYGGEPANG